MGWESSTRRSGVGRKVRSLPRVFVYLPWVSKGGNLGCPGNFAGMSMLSGWLIKKVCVCVVVVMAVVVGGGGGWWWWCGGGGEWWWVVVSGGEWWWCVRVQNKLSRNPTRAMSAS